MCSAEQLKNGTNEEQWMTDTVSRAEEEGVLILLIDRPAKKNALTSAMYAALAEALQMADADPAIRAILI
jgi:enoyl-CoA hydratase/carnithine racemase